MDKPSVAAKADVEDGRVAEPLLAGAKARSAAGAVSASASGTFTEVEHWRLFERVMDLFWAGFMIFAVVYTFQLAPDGLGGGSTGWFTAILGVAIWVSIAAYLVLRPVRHVIRVTGDSVTYSEYRCFGYVLRRTETFARNDLGCLVFDTERRWCGLRGFLGVYVTRGVPTHGAPVRVAFQIPIIYNGWVMNALRPAMVGAHFNTFKALERALGFQRIIAQGHTQTTTRTWSGGDWAFNMTQLANTHMDALLDSLASYDEYVSVNQAIYPSSFTCAREISGGRAVYFVQPTKA
jgi:hypothetical protein